ncbi:transposase [Streptomyces sp. YKOK-I1]
MKAGPLGSTEGVYATAHREALWPQLYRSAARESIPDTRTCDCFAHTYGIDVVADAAYHGKALRDLPVSVTFTTRLPSHAVLYALAPPPTGRRGRPRLKGDRLGTPAELAATLTFTPQAVTRYGRTETVFTAETTCLWYGSFHTRTVKVVLLREDATDTGYDLALVSTDLTAPAGHLVARYAARWSIEVTFGEARSILGVGQAHHRTRRAVERGVPFGQYCYTITVISDMTAKLRRTIIAARFMPIDAGQPTDTEIRAVQEAWAAASADLA